ncbi:MAG: phage late control D family protein, partial [Myxococcales bacterium]|nr:phage late control D family protein [Myxococcales bacterium]
MFALDQQMKPELSGISTPLWVHQMDIVERMSGLWEIELVVRSESPDLDLEAPIGRPARLSLTGRMKTQVLERTFSGICTKLGQVRVEADGASTYAVSLRPALWALTQRTNYRLFQHLTVVEIANALLDEWEIERELRLDLDRYPVLELRTQYGESDHAFLARLLEEFGISYFFEEAGGTAKLVLSDNPGRGELRAQPLPYTDDPSLHAVTAGEFATKGHVVHRALPGAFASRDYDFRRPGYRLFTSTDAGSEAEARWEQFDYTPGGYLHEHNEGGQTPHADDKGPGRHEEGFGKKRTELAMLRTRAEKASYQVDSNVIDLAPGRLFTVVDHPHPAFGESLLVIENRIHRDDEEEESFTVTTRAVPASVPYFPPITIDK